MENDVLFHQYFIEWVKMYKQGSVRQVTLNKYLVTHSWIKKLSPNLKLIDLNRNNYQKLINDYGNLHEKQTTKDFHTQIKAAIEDALEEGFLEKNPVYKIIIKGKMPRKKKPKFLQQEELQKLLSALDLGESPNWHWFILLLAKTGMRFSEALALTPKDFDFQKQTITVNKTWDYKFGQGFTMTKNHSSIRTIVFDWQSVVQFTELLKGLPEDKPIFIKHGKKIYNSTVNDILERLCKKAEIPIIGLHSLRHTHASILLKEGVSIASVAKRLGHSNMATTQKVYLHLINALENKDNLNVMRAMAGL